MFLVERYARSSEARGTTIVGAFSNFDDAVSYKEACVQEWIDKGFYEEIDNGSVVFNVTMTTYYG